MHRKQPWEVGWCFTESGHTTVMGISRRRNAHGCRPFSAQPLPVKHADVSEPLGFVKGGYSVEQFPPDKVCQWAP